MFLDPSLRLSKIITDVGVMHHYVFGSITPFNFPTDNKTLSSNISNKKDDQEMTAITIEALSNCVSIIWVWSILKWNAAYLLSELVKSVKKWDLVDKILKSLCINLYSTILKKVTSDSQNSMVTNKIINT